MNIFSRIDQFIDFKGISKNEFRLKLGLSNSYMSKMQAKNGNIGSQIIEKIVRNYPEMNLTWLITGEGEMLSGNNTLNNSNDMDCSKCPYQKDIERYQRDLARYEKLIDTLNSQIDALQASDNPQTKQKCA